MAQCKCDDRPAICTTIHTSELALLRVRGSCGDVRSERKHAQCVFNVLARTPKVHAATQLRRISHDIPSGAGKRLEVTSLHPWTLCLSICSYKRN
jgi:hypothetical protein